MVPNFNKDTLIRFRVSSKDKQAFKEAVKILNSDISKILTEKIQGVIQEVKKSNGVEA